MVNAPVRQFARALVTVFIVIIGYPLAAFGSEPKKPGSGAIEREIDAMTAEQRMGQLLLVGFDKSHVHADLKEMVKDWRVGGVIFYKRNIVSGDQTRKVIEEIRSLVPDGPPPFATIDQEGGWVVRFPQDVPALPGNMALGATRSPELSKDAGYATGSSLRALGFTMNLAPVLDVLRDPRSTLGTRSFGSEPQLVATLGAAFLEGQTEAGILSVAKHFVGEGSATGDSHHDHQEVCDDAFLLDEQLEPFRLAIRSGLPAIMTSHVSVPALTGLDRTPGTVSKALLSDVLRDGLGFEGIIITDAMEMRALSRHDSLGERAVAAIEAGADMVLSSGTAAERRSIYRSLREAYRSGRLTETRVRESLRRILRAKMRLNSREPRHSQSGSMSEDLAERIANDSVTLVHDESRLLPLWGDSKAGGVAYVGPDGILAHDPRMTRHVVLPAALEPYEAPTYIEKTLIALQAPGVLIAVCMNGRQAAVLNRIIAQLPRTKVIAIAFGDPGDLQLLSRADTVIAAFSNVPATQTAVKRLLEGTLSSRGTLPVRLKRIPLPSGQATAVVDTSITRRRTYE